MNYRGPNANRIGVQRDVPMQFAGNTAVWRQYVSASAGLDYAGYGDAPFYREQLITATVASVMGMGFRLNQLQMPAGMVVSAEFMVVTREKMGPQDELLWQGKTYRIESESVPSRINGTWVNVLKRGDG